MTERRYSDEEVDAIFTRASEVEHDAPQRLQSAEGRTLAELQAIGREAGLSPEAVAQAARALDQPVDRNVQRVDGGPRSSGDSNMVRRSRLRAWRGRGVSRAR